MYFLGVKVSFSGFIRFIHFSFVRFAFFVANPFFFLYYFRKKECCLKKDYSYKIESYQLKHTICISMIKNTLNLEEKRLHITEITYSKIIPNHTWNHL